MARAIFFLAFSFALALLSSSASANVVKHTFNVRNLTVQRLCNQQVIPAVNGMFPGPTIKIHEGDKLIVHVNNHSPYNITIHWHGVFQIQTCWADGPVYITQCPITPGNSSSYKFNVTGQEGTLWWHAHFGVLRATIHGALIILPRRGRSYPFPKPHKEFPIILGEYWKHDIVEIVRQALDTGGAADNSDAYTINGQPGDLYPLCSSNHTYKLDVVKGKTYKLRIINAALNNQLFFKLAGHRFKVVSIDASYTEPYDTDVIVVAPGQTTDVLFTANQPIGNYYMAASAYSTARGLPFENGTTTGIIRYKGATSARPLLPIMPASNDTITAHRFYTNLTSLVTGPHWLPCPVDIDNQMFVTYGLGLVPCGGNNNCSNPIGPQYRFAASMNNVSFQFPSRLSMLEAFYFGVDGIYTEDFPNHPPIVFDYTNTALSASPLRMTSKATRVKKVKYNATVEIVLQNTALLTVENHPMHLHGFDFYVLAQGFGNFNRTRDSKKFNLYNPQERNTIAAPVGGWAVIRFRANNPGVWFIHCHLDAHLPWGLATAFVVENGPTPATSLPPPPPDLPQCGFDFVASS